MNNIIFLWIKKSEMKTSAEKKEEKKNLHTAFRLLFFLAEETLENLLFFHFGFLLYI